MELRKGRHSVSSLQAHLIFVTKYRGEVFTAQHLESMEIIMREICRRFDTELVNFNGENNYVHLLVSYPPKCSISKLVNGLKGASSRKIKMMHPELSKPTYMKDALWSPSYFAASVGGAPIDVLKRYIEQQDRPH